MNTHDITFALAAALLQPARVLHAYTSSGVVTAGCGVVIDWRDTKAGEELIRGADAFDTARVFLGAAGWRAAAMSLEDER